MFDVALRDRRRRASETVEVCKQAWSGKPFDFRGHTVQITPAPASSRACRSLSAVRAKLRRACGSPRRRLRPCRAERVGLLPRRVPKTRT
ncbi:hypothetical protein [uncultured Mycobacterium sp.]|uniref:hypothetical protein n=1 Tax=uncultured Mycobacterium sp. TaxID=171292 RepID=UPI0035CC92B2